MAARAAVLYAARESPTFTGRLLLQAPALETRTRATLALQRKNYSPWSIRNIHTPYGAWNTAASMLHLMILKQHYTRRLAANDVLVISGDLVTKGLPEAVTATHRRNGGTDTALLCSVHVSSPSDADSSGGKVKAKKSARLNIIWFSESKIKQCGNWAHLKTIADVNDFYSCLTWYFGAETVSLIKAKRITELRELRPVKGGKSAIPFIEDPDRTINFSEMACTGFSSVEQERMEYIDRDQCEYSFGEKDKEIQDALLNPDPCKNHTVVLNKTLSCSYLNLPFNEALRQEGEKPQVELQMSQGSMVMGQCVVIQHLLGVPKTVANSIPEKCTNPKVSEKTDSNHKKNKEDSAREYDECPKKQKDDCSAQGSFSPSSYGHDLVSSTGLHSEEWHKDLLGCYAEPSLCLRTFFFPCGTFSRIAPS
ncbi:hypothetical protein ABZP36_010098 [Zizania latifolia]